MFSLTRCGISSIRYSVSSRSKSTASIAGRSGEASGQVDILSVSSFFWFQTERSEERSNIFDGVVVVVFSASLPSACCSRLSLGRVQALVQYEKQRGLKKGGSFAPQRETETE
jgi:hypothetical protein